MKVARRLLLGLFAVAALALVVGSVGTAPARADWFSDHQLAGLLGSGQIYVTGEPGYEEGMWHHVTPAEFVAITETGAGPNDVGWYVGDSSVLPGTSHIDPVVAAPLESDHQLAGLLTTGQVYVAGEPGYAAGTWHAVTPTELATITDTGAGWFDITWYYDELPGTIDVGT